MEDNRTAAAETQLLKSQIAALEQLLEVYETSVIEKTDELYAEIAERKRAEEAVRESRQILRTMLDTIPVSVFWKDRNLIYRGCNKPFALDSGFHEPEELLGKDDFAISRRDQAELFRAEDRKIMESGIQKLLFEEPKTTPDGKTIWLITSKTPLLDAAGNICGVLGVYMDVTARKQAEEEMRESETKFRTLFESANDSTFLMDQDVFIDCNQKALVMFGCTKEQIIGQTPFRFSPEVQPDGENSLKKAREKISAAMSGQSQFFEWKHSRFDETLFDAEVSMNAFSAAGKNYLQVLVHDITERKRNEEKIQYLATHDCLTGLPNRLMFSQQLTHSIQSARRNKRQLAVFFIDLDHFKIINDTKGHDTGDQLLQEIALRYRQLLRATDVVSRQGGDEFVILIEEVQKLSQMERIARKILIDTVKPIVLQGEECHITASIGISIYPKDGEDAQTLMKNADAAMYFAKEEGKNNFQFYSKKIQTQSTEHLSIEENLRHAMERNELSLHYLAKINSETNEITGVEALLRWKNPILGSVTPAQLIPVAEETGLIIPIGKWVMKTACAQNVAWQQQGLPPVCMAINLSLQQLMDSNLIEDIRTVLHDTGMAPNLLELEITESMVMYNTSRIISVLNKIKNLGVRLAIDNFGANLYSLAQIKNFPVDSLKIDRSLIRNIPKESEDKMITKTIIAMGKTLNLTVGAEGVETVEQMNFLKEHSCDEMQGYYFSKPIEPKLFADLIQKHVLIPKKDLV